MRVSGFVTVNGSRERIDWTIDGDSISAGPGLGANDITVEGVAVYVPEEVSYSDGYDDLTVTDLRTMLSQRGEPVYGNKEQLIARLRGWDANNPDGYQQVAEVVNEETSADDFVDNSDDAYDEAGPEDESGEEIEDESDGVEGE